MPPNSQAQKNHDALFPGHVSTLAVTDPELIETFDNFAFDEVMRETKLDERTRLMVQLAATIACQALSEYRVMLGAALAAGVTPIEIKEIVYQAVPYVGMAKVFDFLHATNEVLVGRGAKLPLPGQSTTTPRRAPRRALPSKKRLSARIRSRNCIRHRLRINCTSSAFCRRIALVTITRAQALTCARVSFSRSACSSPLEDASHRSKAMWRPICISAMTARGSSTF
jgi:alkylhydroperoxidase/carboxymuconolactone decarboxylase family protein YurZ